MTTPLLTAFIAAIAGGLAVYLVLATKPARYDEPADVFVAGVRIQQVSGASGTRPRILMALGALLACLIYLVGALTF